MTDEELLRAFLMQASITYNPEPTTTGTSYTIEIGHEPTFVYPVFYFDSDGKSLGVGVDNG